MSGKGATEEVVDDGLAISDEGGTGQGDYPHPLNILKTYFPPEENMRLKGRLERRYMPVNLSSIAVLFDLYPEVAELREPILTWVKFLEERLTSVDGQSREEYTRILEAMLSGLKSDITTSRDKQSFYERIFSAGGTSDE